MPIINFDGEFVGNSQYQTKSIELNQGNIKTALLVIPGNACSNINNFSFYLTNDGGSTWWQVTNNVTFVFPTTGQDLRFRVITLAGEIMRVRQSNGTDSTWTIKTTH